MAIGKEVDFFFREINSCLDVNAQADQLLGQVMHTQRKRTLQRAQCVTCSLCRAGLDQVGNRFSLCEVEFVVQERTFTEFSRPCQAATQLQAALQQHIQNHGPAVALQFQDVLAGE